MSTSTTKKFAVALLGAAALVTFGTTGNALAGGFKGGFKNMKFEHERHFHFGHWGRDRFNYGGECFLVVKPWGIEKVCPDYDDDE